MCCAATVVRMPRRLAIRKTEMSVLEHKSLALSERADYHV
jgi:hypothetical protein